MVCNFSQFACQCFVLNGDGAGIAISAQIFAGIKTEGAEMPH